MDVNAAAVRETLHQHKARRLIHGHTHRPAFHAVTVLMTDPVSGWYWATGTLTGEV